MLHKTVGAKRFNDDKQDPGLKAVQQEESGIYLNMSMVVSAEGCARSKRYHELTVIELGLRGHMLLFLFLLVLRPQHLFPSTSSFRHIRTNIWFV